MRADDDVWAELMPLWNALEDTADIAFYQGLAATARRPVVELGVGYGRVARHVRPDVGVDLSPAALRRCARVLPAATLLLADVGDYHLAAGPAGFSYAAQNLLSLLPDGAAGGFFAAVRRNTRPGGRFAFDAAVPQWDRISRRLGRRLLRGRVGQVALWYRLELADPARRALRVHHTVEWLDRDGRPRTRRHYPPVPVCYLSPDRVRELLADTGWRVERTWGGFAGQPLTDRSSRQVWLVRSG